MTFNITPSLHEDAGALLAAYSIPVRVGTYEYQMAFGTAQGDTKHEEIRAQGLTPPISPLLHPSMLPQYTTDNNLHLPRLELGTPSFWRGILVVAHFFQYTYRFCFVAIVRLKVP